MEDIQESGGKPGRPRKHPKVEEVVQENVNLKAELAAYKEIMAKHVPVSITDDHQPDQVGQDGVASFQEGILVKPETKTLDDPELMAKLADEQFMQEPVKVHIHQVSEDQADISFDVSVNGKPFIFFRGQEYTVPRKYVEGLARAKKTTFRNVHRINQNNGEQEYVYPSKTGLRFPFSVVEDRNPKGRMWLDSVLRQP